MLTIDLVDNASTRPISRSRSSPSTATYFTGTPGTQLLHGSYHADPYGHSLTPYQNSHVSHSRSQNAYHAMGHARSRSNQDIMHSMLTPVSDVPQRSPPEPITATNHRRVSWERSGFQGGIPSPLPGLGRDGGSDAFQWSSNSDHFMNFDAPTWNDALSSPMATPNMPVHSYFPSEGYKFALASPVPSPPPYSGPTPSYSDVKRQVSPASSSSSTSRRESRRGSLDNPGNGKSCSHCHATSTPLWRREPTTLKPLCNACGLYLQQRNKHRPQELIDADAADDSSEESEGDGTGPECSHCRTHHTSVWRRSKTGAQLCNACGVYSRLRGRDRPLSLKRNKIKPRSKHNPTPK